MELNDLYNNYLRAKEELENKIDELLNTKPEFKTFKINESDAGYYEIYSEQLYPNDKRHLGYMDRISLAELILDEQKRNS